MPISVTTDVLIWILIRNTAATLWSGVVLRPLLHPSLCVSVCEDCPGHPQHYAHTHTTRKPSDVFKFVTVSIMCVSVPSLVMDMLQGRMIWWLISVRIYQLVHLFQMDTATGYHTRCSHLVIESKKQFPCRCDSSEHHGKSRIPKKGIPPCFNVEKFAGENNFRPLLLLSRHRSR